MDEKKLRKNIEWSKRKNLIKGERKEEKGKRS